MKSARILSFALVAVLSVAAADGSSPDQPEFYDEGTAREWCDKTPLRRIEGIWEFPEDETRVLVRRHDNSSAAYDLIVVRTPDCAMKPGDKIGTLHSLDGNTGFELSLIKGPGSNPMADLLKCRATLSADGCRIAVEPPKLKVSFRSLSFLPRFLRMLRVSVSNPADKGKRGIIRVYPPEQSNLDIIYY
ncbi:MAG: hypothetical protein K2M37_04135 [Muribaculaceae bacterium]|nr:hypothetical protein [Muribaculaceae bacterium]